MRIAICDDDETCCAQILEIAKDYAAQKIYTSISIDSFIQAEDLLEAAEKIGGFDVYILDIVMFGMNGIALGIELRRRGYDGRIIYMTSSEEYAIDAFKAKAFNYILKPVQKETLLCALSEALDSISVQKESGLIVKTKENSVKLPFGSILYAELCRRVIVYHLADGSTVESIQIRTTFSEAIQALLRDKRFIACGSSMVVNLQHITMVDKDALLFKNTYTVYLPKKSCGAVRSAWYDFWFNGGE